jgi:gluconate 5-dehydrogenase
MSLDKFKLNGRRALITGSSQGIGLAIARGLAEAGAEVVLNGRDPAKLAAAARNLAEAGLKVSEAVFDVTDGAGVAASVADLVQKRGAIDILVNNAGIQRRAPLDQFSDEDWSLVLKTNLDSVFYVSKAVAQGMIAKKYGSIINICSVMSELARPTVVPYTASKGGVKMLTKGMATDWGRHGIRVNGIGPGYFATELNKALIADEKFSGWVCGRTPLGRWGDLDELAGAAVFLASDAASFVTGHILYVDGGMTGCV